MPATQRISGVFLVAALLAAQACDYGLSNCGPVEYNEVAEDPQYQFKMYHQQPNSCPVPFTQADADAGGKLSTFEAWVTSNRDAAVGGGTAYFIDASGNQNDQDNLYFIFYQTGPDLDRGDVIGSYVTGRGGLFGRFAQALNKDWAYIQAIVQDGRVADASIELAYGPRYAGQIAGPSDVEEGSGFSLAPQVNDDRAVYPMTYQWYQDGAPLGGPTQDPSPIYVPGQSGGTTTQFHLLMTDALGDSYQTLFHNVWIYYSGGCDEPPCSR